MFEERDAIRAKFVAPVVRGIGLEIGAGAYPQALPEGAFAHYFDIRTPEQAAELFGKEVVDTYPMSEISRFFPSGGDFLIAHNVLEHIPDPIGGLIVWNRLVHKGGSVVISLPHRDYCPDGLRVAPEFSHLLNDFLTKTDGSDLGSREHILAFATSWYEDYCRSNKFEKIGDFTDSILKLYSTANDCHWHPLDTRLSLRIVTAAAEFGGTQIGNLRCWSPEKKETIGDILVSYSILSYKKAGRRVRRLVRLSNKREQAIAEMSRYLKSKTANFP